MIKAVIFDMYETLISQECGEHYFGPQMAIDAGIPKEQFLTLWLSSKYDRTIGQCSIEEIVKTILKNNDCYSKELLLHIINKRIDVNKSAFENIHPHIFPMLEAVKKRGLKLGLISNCFSDECVLIRESKLFPLFDSVCLSYEEGVYKPEHEIYSRCVKKLKVEFEECLYVGDGGNNELFAAKELGMNVIQAAWYINQQTDCQTKRCYEFYSANAPIDVVTFIEKL